MISSQKRKIVASAHAMVLVALALVMALSAQFSSRAWFSTNDKVNANGLTVSSVRANMFKEIHYYRGTQTRLLTDANGAKYNEYDFSYSPDALNFSPSSGTPERDSFADSISLLEHSDLSANSQVLIRVEVEKPGQYQIAMNTVTTEYLGNRFAAQIQNGGPYDISPVNPPLSSVVHFAVLTSATVHNNAQDKMLTLADKDLGGADMKFVQFGAGGEATFQNPFAALPNQQLTVTVGEDCYIYIFVDYYLPAIEDVVEKTLSYVDSATKKYPSYSDIVVGHTNLIFTVDFEFVVSEVTG